MIFKGLIGGGIMTEESQNQHQQEQPPTSPDLQPITIPSTPDLELCQQALQAVQNQQEALNEQMAAGQAAMLAAAKAMDEEEANKRQNTRRVGGFLGIGFLLTAIVGLWGGKKLFSGDQGSVGGEPPPNPPKETSNGVTILPAQDNVVHVQTEKVLGNGGIETADVAFNTSAQATHIKKILENNAPAEAVLYLKDHANEMRKWGNVGGSALDNPNLDNHGLGAFNGGNSKGNLADIYEKIQKNATLNGAEQGSLNNTLQRLQEATGDTSPITGTSKEKIEKIIALKDEIARETQAHYDALLKPPVSRASVDRDKIAAAFDGVSDMGNTLGVEPIPAHHGGLFHGVGDAMRDVVHTTQDVAQQVMDVANPILHNPVTQTVMSVGGKAMFALNAYRTIKGAMDRNDFVEAKQAWLEKNYGQAVQCTVQTLAADPQFRKEGSLLGIQALTVAAAPIVGLGAAVGGRVAMTVMRHQDEIQGTIAERIASTVKWTVEDTRQDVCRLGSVAWKIGQTDVKDAAKMVQETTQITMAVASETLSKVQDLAQDFLKAMPWFSKFSK